MFAVVKTGGKQYKVSANDIIRVEKIEADAGDVIALNDIIAVGSGDNVTFGTPFVEGASIGAEVVDQKRTRKIIIFKKRRRKNSRRKNGHRQHYTVLKITEILTGGKKVEVKKAPPKVAVTDRPFEKLSEAEGKADDLKLIGGVGAAIEKKLNAAGIYHFWQIASLTEEQTAEIESEVGFKGRILREDWKGQVIELMSGKAPRAKSDQEYAKKKQKEG